MTIAVLIMAYGGPTSLDEVEPFLRNVRGGRISPPDAVDRVKSRYAAIGGKSPLLEITQSQGAALQARLNEAAGRPHYQVYVGMRHWHPHIAQTVQAIQQAGHARLVALCLTPHSSQMSTQVYFDALASALQALGGPLPGVRQIADWHLHPRFIEALATKVRQGLQRLPAAARASNKVIFTAHSLPASLIESGDPYAHQVQQTAAAVAAATSLPEERWEVVYQSGGAPNMRWLGPSLAETLERLAQQAITDVLVAPIGFVSDHVETLYDLDIEAARQARALGLRWDRAGALNTDPTFIQALAEIVLAGDPV